MGYYIEGHDWLFALDARFSPTHPNLLALTAEGHDLVRTTDDRSRKEQWLFVYDVAGIDWQRPPEPNDRRRYALFSSPVASYHVGEGRDRHQWLIDRLIFRPDGSELLVLGFDGATGHSSGALIRVDVASMSELRAPIVFDARYAHYDGLLQGDSYWNNHQVTHIDVDPTGRFVVLNRWETATIGVIDLETEESWTLPVPGFEADEDSLVLDGNAVAKVSFNKTEFNRGLLAIHGLDRIGIYALAADGRSLELRDLEHVDRGLIYAKDGPGGPVPRGSAYGAIDWTGDGRYVVAAGAAEGPEEVHSWRVSETDGQMLDHRSYEACRVGYNQVHGLVTLNGLIPTSTPTPSRTSDPSQTPTATATPHPTLTASSTPTASRTPSPVPATVYLPLLLRESCDPSSRLLDVVLLIDTSTSMAEDGGDGSGHSKLDAAIDAGSALLGELRLARGPGDSIDRASIIGFDAGVLVRQGLTHDADALRGALAEIELSTGSRLDLGIQAATDELTGPRQRLGANRVMIVLTDGRATGGPRTAVERADIAKALGITIFTVGLGEELDRDALVEIASRPELCTLLPTAADLIQVFRSLGRNLSCPPWTYWGGR